MTKTAIVILNWNGADMMRRFLPGVIANSPEAEVIVADNASTDGSLEMLSSEFPEVSRIILDRNYGFADGYNKALRQVEAEYYVLLNSDVETPHSWLDPLVRYMDSNPDVSACQPVLRSQWNKEYFEYAGAAGGYVDALGYPYCRGRLMATVEKDEGQYGCIANVLWATGACMMIRSKDYWQAGGLDGRFFAHQEEIDLCWRLRSRGRGIVCIPDSIVYHLGGGTLPQGNPRKTFLNFRNNLLLLYKNLPDNRLADVMRIRLWLDALASLKFLLTLQWGSFRAVWRARREYNRIKSDFRKDREENLRLTVLSPVPEQGTFSLLYQYYIRGKRKFSQLPRS
ncbi:MAG: glycosyltransferase family 2 protein [Bacteroidaceae bacterium]|nr:glycosyltransferase family 2 protein [Bacteroidaceae bacterium]